LPARVIDLAPGDMLVLVTDGFYECCNPAGEMLGAARLSDFIRRHQSLDAAEIIRRLHQDLIDFSHGTPQADDITAVIIKRIC
jgi:serine phosphatase RsbU (regulator of sigma subunit)